MTSAELLDRVHTLATLEAFDADQYLALVASELPTEAEACQAALATACEQIETLIARVMRIRLDLVADALPAPTRRVFASTIATYANDLPLLAERVRDVAHRAGVTAPERIAEGVGAAAREVLALRDRLRAGVLARMPAPPEPEAPAPEVTFADMIELD